MTGPPAPRAAFRVLFREFFGQFFASESVTSDIHLRRAMIAVIAFLLTPGWMLSVSMLPLYEYARARAPQMIEPITRLLATLFIAFSMVSIGLIGALVWEALSFDRRDAMVLGPLPLSRGLVVTAKLTAMAAFLLGASLAINLVTAVPFSFVSSDTLAMIGRNFLAHLVTTTAAGVVVFSALVILRGLLGLTARGHVATALASLLQFAFISAVLCYIILLPGSFDLQPRGRGVMTLEIADIPAWTPTRWFLAIFVQLRGTGEPETAPAAWFSALATLAAAGGAVLTTVAGYRRQLQLALTPAASTGAVGGARISRAIARAIAGRNRAAQATSDFILATLARNRAQQAPIAINAAIGLAILIFGVVTARGTVAATLQAPDVRLAAPLILVFWIVVGVRAAFFVPSELPAAWMFHANAPRSTSAYALGTRAALMALVGPPASLIAAAVAAPIGGWPTAITHGVFVALVVMALADFIVLTIDGIPFTRPYEPGHAKLKSRWPIYLLGSSGFGYGLASLELMLGHDAGGVLLLLAGVTAVIAVFEVAVRHAGRAWSAEPRDARSEEYESVTVLDLGAATMMKASKEAHS